MKQSHVIIFLLTLALFLIYFRNRSCTGSTGSKSLEISSVKDGNTIVLSNGTLVTLIGVTSTVDGKKYLQKFEHKKVNLTSDRSARFNAKKLKSGKRIYAYVKVGENHLNASLLKSGKADLLRQSHLTDSLANFRKYAQQGSKRREKKGVVIPEPTPIEPIPYPDDNIILPDPPSPDKKRERRHSAWYTDGNMNLDMLKEACDYDCPYTKQFANSLAGRSQGTFNAGQICEIFDYCYNNWKYVNDPKGQEYLAMASESIENNLCGDCDDFAILMASCILAIGGDACVNTGHGPEGGHAFTEVDISGIGESNMLKAVKGHFPQCDISKLNTRRDGGHLWLNLDWWASYPGGRYFNSSYSRDAYPCVNGRWTWTKLK